MAQLIALADALVVRIQTFALGLQFDVCRKLLPIFRMTDKGIRLLVVPGGASWEFLTRGQLSADEKIVDIGVFKKLGYAAESPDFDKDGGIMLAFIESLVAQLKVNRRYTGFTLMTVANDPIYDVNRLREEQAFLSVLRLTFKGSD